ncbi:MAG TPA: MFS transporter [Steroidobacter sp.]|nr:MFS transporter [Steroidobacter sp.]
MKTAARAVASGDAAPRLFYGWFLVGSGFVLQGLATAAISYSYGVVLAPIAGEFGASRLQMMWGITALMLVSGAVSPFLGAAMDRQPLRRLALLGGCLLGGGFALLSVADAIWHVVLVYALFMAPAMILIGPTLVGALLARWFSRRRGAAMGVAALGTSVFGLATPLLLQFAIAAVGWRSALLGAGVVMLLVVAPAAWIVRDRPQVLGLGPDGDQPVEAQPTAAGATHSSATTRGILAQRNFWLICLVLGLLFSAYNAMMTNLVPLARDHGHTAELAAMLMSAIAACGMVGKLVFGVVADRVDLRVGLGAAIVLVIISLLLLAADSRYITLFIASSLLGFAAGGMLPVWGTLMAVLFGVAHYGRAMGLMNPVMMPLMLLGSPFAGWSYDRSGSYMPALLSFALVLLLALAALSRIRMPEKRA